MSHWSCTIGRWPDASPSICLTARAYKRNHDLTLLHRFRSHPCSNSSTLWTLFPMSPSHRCHCSLLPGHLHPSTAPSAVGEHHYLLLSLSPHLRWCVEPGAGRELDLWRAQCPAPLWVHRGQKSHMVHVLWTKSMASSRTKSIRNSLENPATLSENPLSSTQFFFQSLVLIKNQILATTIHLGPFILSKLHFGPFFLHRHPSYFLYIHIWPWNFSNIPI
jgi:hypothetical protein